MYLDHAYTTFINFQSQTRTHDSVTWLVGRLAGRSHSWIASCSCPCPTDLPCICSSFIKNQALLTFWAAAQKGQCPVEHRGDFEKSSVRPSFRPSTPPCWPSRPGVSPPRPQFSPPGLKLALLASNQPPPHATNLPSRPQICPPDLQSALQA